jgi:small subunit ribosomal protein S14
MAKQSMINKNKRRIAKVAQYRVLRAELKEIIRNPKSGEEEYEAAVKKLRSLPRDSSRTRVRNRCLLTGRPRGYYRKFGLSRLALRENALEGLLPGVKKASW